MLNLKNQNGVKAMYEYSKSWLFFNDPRGVQWMVSVPKTRAEEDN